MTRSILISAVLILACQFIMSGLFAQTINSGSRVSEDFIRREQLKGDFSSNYSFQIRPIYLQKKDSSSALKTISQYLVKQNGYNKENLAFTFLPLFSNSTFNSKMPYGWGNNGMVPNVGLQTYLSTGFYARFHFLEIQFQPEYVYAQNKPFQGFSDKFSTNVIRSRFFYWNNGDNPERFGTDEYSRFWWGQSNVNVILGPVNLGVSTQNIWWGPGQFNALIFSNNAEGFPHLHLSTRRPLKTIIGNFETQIIVGRLENSGLNPTQNEFLNNRYFEPLDGDWRYLNGLTITYNPSFLKNMFVGFSRTFQQYNKLRGKTFNDYFPVFEVFQKKTFLENGNSVEYDSRGQDQQVAISFRYIASKAHFEVYGEYGRRDHSYNWREFTLNPEHARAYIAGFQKLFSTGKPQTYILIRGEMTHQQESVNRYIRYMGLTGNQTWHTHGRARGFVNYGQALGVGSGVGSNVQTIEIAHLKGLNKRGILLERLENNQDFYYRAFGQDEQVKPWIDLSLGLLWDQQWNKLILSGKTQFIRSYNYQWQSGQDTHPDFPRHHTSWAFYGSLNLIYKIQ